LLDAIDPEAAARFKLELNALLQQYPAVSQAVMDFPANWQQDSFWH
jgi:hypothetical protein